MYEINVISKEKSFRVLINLLFFISFKS